jgi:pimeloyl-ACP methyl ester carboxylesterase
MRSARRTKTHRHAARDEVPDSMPAMTAGATTLVMLPGLDGTGLLFEPLIRCLPEEVSPLVVRYPVDRPMSFQEHVAYARGHLPADRPFVLLAESFSGPISLQLLAEPPDNLLGVIFVATFARPPRPFLVDAACHLPQALLLKLVATPPVSRFLCLGRAPVDAIALFRRAMLSVKLNVLSRRLQILAELPPPPDTPYTGPALYLQASRDRLVPPRAVEALAGHLPQLVVKNLSGPHIILLAQPVSGAGLISDFIFGLRLGEEQS